jgi:rod shape-determining protein MreB
VVDSYIGWPVDMVARKLVKKPVLFGQEALENRPMLDLHRPLERGLIKEGSEKDELAVRELIRHMISLTKPHDGQKVLAVVGVPAEALRVSHSAHPREWRIAHDVSEPSRMTCAVAHDDIDIGAGTVDFCVMKAAPTDEDGGFTNAGDSWTTSSDRSGRAYPRRSSRSTWYVDGRRSGASLGSPTALWR